MVRKFGLYAYGIVGRKPGQLNILGIDKKNGVFFVGRGGLYAVVSKIDIGEFEVQLKKGLSGLAASERVNLSNAEETLRGHEEVVETFMKLATIIPLKFGTVLKDRKAALKMLQSYKKRFKSLLAKLIGKEEWGVKVYADDQEFKDHLAQIEPASKDLEEKREKLSKGAAYLLGRKIDEELENKVACRLAEVTKVIFEEVGKGAYEAKLNKVLPKKLTGKKKEMVLNTAYLVEKEKVARFNEQAKRLIEKYKSIGLEIEVSGPWPPYSFT